MSAVLNPNAITELVSIEVDGKPMQVAKGSMIIQATDKARIPVPRFCYHEKLPIAANCRMCLVDVEKSPKPVPACATPVMEGMKVFTRSARALGAQRNVMEFLLINHPLDCPICDQGGECELQDVAMGYGRSVSRFSEQKRVIPDEDLGPLIATDMTRCIQCTRCVRFMSEIAGTTELGGMGRGEYLEIGTYIGKSIGSEIGGNIIDICPVGALTNKPFRFKARAWELIARESIGYHDAIGSNLFLHTRRGAVLRTVPKDNEAINENWLSDRDRFSHQGLEAGDRALLPMIRRQEGGPLQNVSWEEAIMFVADGLRASVESYGAQQLAACVAPATTCEEGQLLGRIVRGLGSSNIDHRLRVIDKDLTASEQGFELPLAQIEQARTILIIGSNPRHDQPLLGHRIRKAWKSGAEIFAINPVAFDFHFSLSDDWVVDPWTMVDVLAGIAKSALKSGVQLPKGKLFDLINAAQPDTRMTALLAKLMKSENSVIIFGDVALQHPAAATLRSLARFIAQATATAFNELPNGANGLGLTRVGVHSQGGDIQGLPIAAALESPPNMLILYGAEVPHDFADSARANAALMAAKFTVAFTPYASASLLAHAHAILPIGLLPEIDGTLINADDKLQRVQPGSKLPGEARAGWKVLRALGSALELDNFQFTEFPAYEADRAINSEILPANENLSALARPSGGAGLVCVATVPIYATDAVVRRSPALQATPLAINDDLVLHPEDAALLGVNQLDIVNVSDGEVVVRCPVSINSTVAKGAAWIRQGSAATNSLAPTGAMLLISKA